MFRKNNFIYGIEVNRLVNRCIWFFQRLPKIVVNHLWYVQLSKTAFVIICQEMWKIKFFVQFRRNQGFNFRILLKVPNVFSRFLEKKLLAFCEANNSHKSALSERTLPKVVKCLCGWNCMALHSFFSNPSFSQMAENLF